MTYIIFGNIINTQGGYIVYVDVQERGLFKVVASLAAKWYKHVWSLLLTSLLSSNILGVYLSCRELPCSRACPLLRFFFFFFELGIADFFSWPWNKASPPPHKAKVLIWGTGSKICFPSQLIYLLFFYFLLLYSNTLSVSAPRDSINQCPAINFNINSSLVIPPHFDLFYFILLR